MGVAVEFAWPRKVSDTAKLLTKSMECRSKATFRRRLIITGLNTPFRQGLEDHSCGCTVAPIVGDSCREQPHANSVSGRTRVRVSPLSPTRFSPECWYGTLPKWRLVIVKMLFKCVVDGIGRSAFQRREVCREAERSRLLTSSLKLAYQLHVRTYDHGCAHIGMYLPTIEIQMLQSNAVSTFDACSYLNCQHAAQFTVATRGRPGFVNPAEGTGNISHRR